MSFNFLCLRYTTPDPPQIVTQSFPFSRPEKINNNTGFPFTHFFFQSPTLLPHIFLIFHWFSIIDLRNNNKITMTIISNANNNDSNTNNTIFILRHHFPALPVTTAAVCKLDRTCEYCNPRGAAGIQAVRQERQEGGEKEKHVPHSSLYAG